MSGFGLPKTGIKATPLHTPLVLSLNRSLNLAHRACWCFLRQLKKKRERAFKYQIFQLPLKELRTASFSKRKTKSLSLKKKVDLHSKHVWHTPPATASFTQAKPVLASGPFAPLSPGRFVLVQETCYRKSRNFEPCLSFQMTMNILTVAPAAAVLTITASRLEDI